MNRELSQIWDNWSMPLSASVPRQPFSMRLPAELVAKIQAFAEMKEKNRVEIATDLLLYAVSALSESLPRRSVTKGDLWLETINDDVPRDIFDEAYPGPDTAVFTVGEGVQFDRAWRRIFRELASQAGQSVAPVSGSGEGGQVVSIEGAASNG